MVPHTPRIGAVARLLAFLILISASVRPLAVAAESVLALNDREYFSARGLDVLVFSNWYDGAFSDAKIAGIELIHHGVRTATNGDVRLSPTPGQWDPAPELVERVVDRERGVITTRLAYPAYNFSYALEVQARPGGGVAIRVVLGQPLPAELAGRAGLHLEFLPASYFTKTYYMDAASGVLPLYPSGPSGRDADGRRVPMPIARGHALTLAPEDPARRVTITSRDAELGLFDGRNEAQNGWFVVRSVLPAGKTGTVMEWTVAGNTTPTWTRPPVIAHSQVGYAPAARKVAYVECDPHAGTPGIVRLLRVDADGALSEAHAAPAERWGEYLRYVYYTFDFSAVREPGLYMLEADGVRTHAFRIADDIYATAWQPTLDVFLPVQMDHMLVNEAYRVWHGPAHLDDARQAPPNHEHFDLYAMGPETDSPFAPGEHIPGLNYGGWFDAGDFDIRTQTQYALVQTLVQAWETFRPERDETTVNQARRHVEIHQPDGVPDLLQQVEHGTLGLLAQHRVFGHAIPGIIAPDLGQYTHLGDAGSKTDRLVHDPANPDSPADDRWAFTTATTALNYGSAAALAAASRALRGYRDDLADECLATALRVWNFEHGREPNTFRHGNTTGGNPSDEEFKAAVELLLTTGDAQYAARLNELFPAIEERFLFNVVPALRALPHMDAAYREKVRARALASRAQSAQFAGDNPFGVPITRGGWAGNGFVVAVGVSSYYLHQAFPDDFPADGILRSLEYLHGAHPGSDISFVSGVGTHSKTVAYGSNRADFSFIAGGIVPGILVLKPDFPENKEDWPFLWGENEYVVNLAGSYIFLVHAADELVRAAK